MKKNFCFIVIFLIFSTTTFAAEFEAQETTMIFDGTSMKVIEVTVKPGDNLWELCVKFLGDGTECAYEQIAFDNKIYNPRRIYPEQKIFFLKMRRVGWVNEDTGLEEHSVWNLLSEKDNQWLAQIFRDSHPSWNKFHIDTPTAKGVSKEYIK